MLPLILSLVCGIVMHTGLTFVSEVFKNQDVYELEMSLPTVDRRIAS